MTDNKQYPELPDPTAWRTYDNLLKRARYNAMPITSMQPGIYSHTRMFTEDQMYAYVDADRAMRAAAFPTLEKGSEGLELTDPGMDLRDYFAGQVVGAAFRDLFDGWRSRGEPVQEDWPMGLAQDAYRVADAMVRARAQQERKP